MDLLFSYKGGDELMNNVLLYFALKHDGDFEKIYILTRNCGNDYNISDIF